MITKLPGYVKHFFEWKPIFTTLSFWESLDF